MTMLELCDHIYQNYPGMKRMFPRWQLLSLLDRNEDKIVHVEENGKSIASALYVKLTDKTFSKLKFGFCDTTNSVEIQELMKESGDNVFILYTLAASFKAIRAGLRALINTENPKTISWYEPDKSMLHTYQIRRQHVQENRSMVMEK